MYKLLLCWRYLRTRYLALACIVSVMLGVATLIVVNSVMSGFSTKLQDRLHGLLSDVVLEATSLNGFPDPNGKMEKIRNSPVGDKIEAMTPTLEVFAMIQFRLPDRPFYAREEEMMTRPIHLIGIDPAGHSKVGGFSQYLVRQKNVANPSFEMPEEIRRWQEMRGQMQMIPSPLRGEGDGRTLSPPHPSPPPQGEREQNMSEPPPPDPPLSQVKIPIGVIVGKAIASFRDRSLKPGDPPKDVYMLEIGDDVIITTVSGEKLAPVYDRFAVCDYFKSEMSEYDANFVFVPLEYLQKLRTMEDRVSSIQIKLKDYRDAAAVVDSLRSMFPECQVRTWEEKQGPLLAAIAIEKGILNILLFLIICVAGFGILAIFSMIVVEKTRDIGILKALGASNGGIMKIFLGYGLLLGVVGAGFGTALGLAITTHINAIEKFLTKITGQEIFDRSIYYFNEIPTDIQPWSVIWVVVGSVGIAVLFSVLPALRAALLHPVRALRYE